MIGNSLSITGCFDGGNPRAASAIVQMAEDTFNIEPFSEDGDKNYKFRLETIVFNHSKQPQRIKLIVNWNQETHQTLRDHVYIKGPNEIEWLSQPCMVSDSNTECYIEFQPGETYLCLQPKYSYEDYLNLIHAIPSKAPAEPELIGKTSKGREVWCVRFSKVGRKPRRKLMAVCRVHPYETAGSFCAHGLVKLFETASVAEAQLILESFDLYLVPMANPDGVYDGLCKLTSLAGINLSREIDLGDKTSRVLKGAIDRIEPDIYVEFHNWMFKDVDGICYLNFLQARKFINNMPSQKQFKKRWRPILRRGLLAYSPVGFKKYCKDRFGSTVAVFEYPWFGRTSYDMERIGVETISALTYLS